MPGKNPNVRKALWSNIPIIISNVQQREGVQKDKIDLPIEDQIILVKVLQFYPSQQ